MLLRIYIFTQRFKYVYFFNVEQQMTVHKICELVDYCKGKHPDCTGEECELNPFDKFPKETT